MELGLWATLALIVLVFMLLAGLCGLQVPLSRRRAFWPGLIQPAVWLIFGLVSLAAAQPSVEDGPPGLGAWVMLGITLAIWAVARLRRSHRKKEN